MPTRTLTQPPSRPEELFCLILLCIAGFCLIAGCLSPGPAPGSGGSPAVPATDAGIRIITEDLPPFNYAGPDGKATGQATEVVNGILARLNRKAPIEILPWNEGYNAARAGPAVALYSTGRTEERERLFKWVGPVTAYDFTFYKKNGSAIELYSVEAAGKTGTIGVVKEDARHQFLKQNSVTNIVTCDTDAACLRLLLDNKIDLWFGSSVNAPSVAAKDGVNPLSFTKVYTVRTVPMYIAFSNDTPDSVISEWQGALDAMKRDGTYAAIRQKYGLDAESETPVASSTADQADLALNHVITSTDSRLTGILHTYRILIQTLEVKSKDWYKIRPLLAAFESNEPDVRTWYANPDGSYYTVSDGLTSANLKGRAYFPVVLAGKESVGSFIIGYTTGKNSAVVAVPVQENGAVTGVLGGSLYVDTLADTIRKDIPAPFVFYAIDRDGRFTLHSEKGQIARDLETIAADSPYGKALSEIRAKESGEIRYEDGGIQYQAKFRTSPLTGWRFVVAWPVSGSA
ncbi:MAG: transporter substrate-binding domain-containing protein [Methanomicrobiales archaeon]|nr:transporter substrate-binding domain-containing protein [Methanomicrobiales archaeon]